MDVSTIQNAAPKPKPMQTEPNRSQTPQIEKPNRNDEYDTELRKTRKPTTDTEPIARLPHQDHFATTLTKQFSGRYYRIIFDNAPTSCRQTLLIAFPHTPSIQPSLYYTPFRPWVFLSLFSPLSKFIFLIG